MFAHGKPFSFDYPCLGWSNFLVPPMCPDIPLQGWWWCWPVPLAGKSLSVCSVSSCTLWRASHQLVCLIPMSFPQGRPPELPLLPRPTVARAFCETCCTHLWAVLCELQKLCLPFLDHSYLSLNTMSSTEDWHSSILLTVASPGP